MSRIISQSLLLLLPYNITSPAVSLMIQRSSGYIRYPSTKNTITDFNCFTWSSDLLSAQRDYFMHWHGTCPHTWRHWLSFTFVLHAVQNCHCAHHKALCDQDRRASSAKRRAPPRIHNSLMFFCPTCFFLMVVYLFNFPVTGYWICCQCIVCSIYGNNVFYLHTLKACEPFSA